MNTLDSVINWFLGFLTAGTITIILVTLLSMIKDPENRETYIKKIKNAVVFLVIALAIFQIKGIVFYYFGTPTFQQY